MSTIMRDGTTVDDPRLGRLPSFDKRSKQFSIRALLPAQPVIKGRTWRLPILLDQGQTSACTGNARAHDLAASPSPLKQANGLPIDQEFAQQIYRLAQTLDEWPGEAYNGSSVLGAAKAAQKLGFIGEYRWAFNIDDMLAALATIGPVVVGTDWRNCMYDTLPSGELIVDPASKVDGGHSYIIRGVIVSEKHKAELVGKGRNRKGVPLMRARNSWGPSYGVNGEMLIWSDDYENHLMPGGEQMITTMAFHR